MKNKIKYTHIFCLFVTLIMLQTSGYAKKPEGVGGGKPDAAPGLAKHAETPPKGWSKGDKKGWDDKDHPPGLGDRFDNLFGGDTEKKSD